MKINGSLEATVLSIVSTESKDGTKTYYKVGIMTNTSEVGMISASENVVQAINDSKKPLPFLAKLMTEFNDQYESFRVVNIDTK